MQYLTPSFESDLFSESNYSRVIGIDEVGRGSWAGPVAVGAFVVEKNDTVIEGVHDSKKISPLKRQLLHAQLKEYDYTVLYGDVPMIDKYGIAKTIEKLILRIIKKYYNSSTFFLIDGKFSQAFGLHTLTVLRGDSTYYSIAAASVMAKVERDALMQKISKTYPEYGFEQHKGYGTKNHKQNILTHGVLPVHRTSYKPIQALL